MSEDTYSQPSEDDDEYSQTSTGESEGDAWEPAAKKQQPRPKARAVDVPQASSASASLMKRSMQELKSACRVKNVAVSGNKEELVERLLNPAAHQKAAKAPAGPKKAIVKKKKKSLATKTPKKPKAHASDDADDEATMTAFSYQRARKTCPCGRKCEWIGDDEYGMWPCAADAEEDSD